ncbi:tyrosine-type recombinase/integrase [Bacillus sp. BRMEA1]|uniref:site-specific integrase n=1 Tax=Neobacillus endophyticus TaxID=2738405 RepID=UPI00156738E1|nr:tyrosine-type recombinase/integrase [Neobacillus endophyticus]NRD78465.1 tyrosine-type recombinase/integrase [Neobacillus endophyticus]
MPVYKDDEKKTWFYVFNFYDENTGKRKQKRKRGFSTKKEATDALRKLEVQYAEGSYIETKNILFKQYIKDWLSIKKISLSNHTLELYERSIKNHIAPTLGNITLPKMKPQHIQKFILAMHEQGLADSTIKRTFNIVNVCLNDAVKLGDIVSNPATKIEKPKLQPKEMNIWTIDQIQHFLECSKGHRLYCIFHLAIMTGLRKGEILGLRWKDVDFEKQVLYVNQTLEHDGKTIKKGAKTKSSVRSVTLSPSTRQVLLAHKKRHDSEKEGYDIEYKELDLIFRSETGSPFHQRNLTRIFQTLTKKAELPHIRFHDLRHTHAALMIAQNEPMKLIAERLGHSKISTTIDTYGHLLPNMQHDASNRLDQTIFGKS